MILSGVAGLSGTALGASSLPTGVIADPSLYGANDTLQFARIRGAGASFVVIPVNWSPRARNPRNGPYRPSVVEFGKFAKALTTRYSGRFHGLPWVRYYIPWDEPNNYRYLTPQRVHGKPYSPILYMKLLVAFSRSAHSVRAGNKIIAGALLAFGIGDRIAPMAFMGKLLCMTYGRHIRPTCKRKVPFDIWSHHPYTRGDPFHHAVGPNDVSLADLPRMHALLNAAVKAGHVTSRHKVGFWVDEFSYDSHPPDPSRLTVPIMLHARWTAEALYQMWRAHVNVGIWFLIRDEPVATSMFQSGLYFAGPSVAQDRPKPALFAFRFPFVAYHKGKRVSVWGRTPTSGRGRVTIELDTRHGWRRVARVWAGRHGIFTGKLRYAAIKKRMRGARSRNSYRGAVIADKPRSFWGLDERSGVVAADAMHHPLSAAQVARRYTASGRKRPTLGMLRASLRKQTSWPFSLKRPPNRYVLAFG